MRIAIQYPNGVLMVYAEETDIRRIKQACNDYNYRRADDSLAKVVRVEVTMHGEVKP